MKQKIQTYNNHYKPNINSCTFTEFKIWVFENYLLGTGNRISTALDVHISDIRFDESTIILRKFFIRTG